MLLGGEDDVNARSFGHGQQLLEPGQRPAAEFGDREQGADVTGEAGQADRVGDGDRDLMSQLVQAGRHLPGGEPRTLGGKNAHFVSIYHKHITHTNSQPHARKKGVHISP
jgi:hypothetical protein